MFLSCFEQKGKGVVVVRFLGQPKLSNKLHNMVITISYRYINATSHSYQYYMSLCRYDRIFRQNQDLSDNFASTQQANICSFCRKKGGSAIATRTFVLRHGGMVYILVIVIIIRIPLSSISHRILQKSTSTTSITSIISTSTLITCALTGSTTFSHPSIPYQFPTNPPIFIRKNSSITSLISNRPSSIKSPKITKNHISSIYHT